jgi:CO/xanthine dehydrogenase FAD-binding subunit
VERSAPTAERAPLLHETMPYIAHPQIRNRGTMGGSVAHADPAAELPAVMLALEARLRACRRDEPDGRWIDAGEFFTGLFATALAPDELLVEIALPPLPPRTGWAFREISRRHGDYALVGVAAVLTLDEAGLCERCPIALFSVGDGPVLARAAAAALAGEAVTDEAIRAAAAAVQRDIDPPGDIHASTAYRRHLAEVLTRQALVCAAARARNGTEGAQQPSS